MRWVTCLVALLISCVAAASDNTELSGLRRVASFEILPEKHWQDVFYEAHRNGQQHFLVYLPEPGRFREVLSPIIKLLQENNNCSIRIVTPEKYHDDLQRRIYLSARTLLKPCNGALSTISRELHFFDPDIWKNLLGNTSDTLRAPFGIRYTGIILDQTRDTYGWLNSIMKLPNSLVYVPITLQTETEEVKKLKGAGFKSHYIRSAGGSMLCASTSGFTTENEKDRPSIILRHEPDNANFLLELASHSGHHSCDEVSDEIVLESKQKKTDRLPFLSALLAARLKLLTRVSPSIVHLPQKQGTQVDDKY